MMNNKGFTLIEVLVSIGIIVIISIGMSNLFGQSSTSNERIQTQSSVNTAVAIAQEKINSYLLEARSIVIDSNGKGLTYKYPPKNTDGSYQLTFKSVESTSRRIYLYGGKLYTSDDETRPILINIPSIDPDTNQTIRIFSTGVNSKELVVRLVSKTDIANNKTVYSAITSRIRPRNIP